MKIFPSLIKNTTISYSVLVLLALIVVISFGANELATTGALDGVPLDDSWIHFRFAKNIREGNGFSYNPGIPTPGSTSPLWDLILAYIGFDYVVPSKIIGVLAYIGIGILVFQIGTSLDIDWKFSLLGGLSTLVIGRLAWLAPSGMESTLFIFVSLLAILLWIRSDENTIPITVSIIFGLAIGLRPEGILLLAISCIDWLIVRRDKLVSISTWKFQIRHIAISFLMLMPYLLFSLLTTGNPLPNTFYARSTTWGCTLGRDYFVWIGFNLFLDNPIALIFAVWGMLQLVASRVLRLKRGIALTLLWAILLPLAYGIIAPCTTIYYLRYTTPIVPLFGVFAAVGGWNILQLLSRKIPPKVSRFSSYFIVFIFGSVIVLGFMITVGSWASHFAQSVNEIKTMHVQIGRWINKNTPSDSIIALNDIGAIAYYSEREVLDLVGLVSPEVLPFIIGKQPGTWDKELETYLSNRKPDYLIVFPAWYPNLILSLDLEPIFRIHLDSPIIVSGDEMIVYRMIWD
jgi:hypothetical protein